MDHKEEEKKFRTALAALGGGVANFQAMLTDLSGHQEKLGKGIAIMPRELAAVIAKGNSAVAATKTALGVINSIVPAAEEDDEETQPAVTAPTDNPKPSSTAAAGEAPAPSVPVVESTPQPETTPVEVGAAVETATH